MVLRKCWGRGAVGGIELRPPPNACKPRQAVGNSCRVQPSRVNCVILVVDQRVMSTQVRSRRVVIQAMLGFLVSGCGSTALTQAPESPSLANADGSTRPGEIRLAAGDKIRVTVFGEDKLS